MADGKILEIQGGAIMPVRPGSMSEGDKAALREIGIVVFEHDNPADVHLIAPFAGNFPTGPVITAAVTTLSLYPSDSTRSGPTQADHMRSYFVQCLAAICKKATDHD